MPVPGPDPSRLPFGRTVRDVVGATLPVLALGGLVIFLVIKMQPAR